MIPGVNSRFYCRLPGGSAFLTFLEATDVNHLRFMIVRDDGVRREYIMSEAEWENFKLDYIVVPLEEIDEHYHSISPGGGEDDGHL